LERPRGSARLSIRAGAADLGSLRHPPAAWIRSTMPGVHVATTLAFVSLAMSCLNTGFQIQSPFRWVLVFLSLLFGVAAAVVVTHARGRALKWLSPTLDDWIGPPPHLATPLPDMSLVEVVVRICLDTKTDAEGNSAPASPQATSEALRAIREGARLGRVIVWGRLDAPIGNEHHTLLSAIPPEVWDVYQIDHLRFLTDPKGRTERTVGATFWYSDLQFNRRQVNVVWPEPGARLRFRKPWYFGE
jgi:hypothetical protein